MKFLIDKIKRKLFQKELNEIAKLKKEYDKLIKELEDEKESDQKFRELGVNYTQYVLNNYDYLSQKFRGYNFPNFFLMGHGVDEMRKRLGSQNKKFARQLKHRDRKSASRLRDDGRLPGNWIVPDYDKLTD